MSIMRNHKLIDTDDPISSGAIAALFVVVLIAVFAWMGNRDRVYEKATECPLPGPGQQLIGRGHMEVDNEPGELLCTYSTAPIGHGMTVASTRL